jgi:hypothetical protein
MKTLILVPGIDGIWEDLYDIAFEVSSLTKADIEAAFEQEGPVKVLIVMGCRINGKVVSSLEAYEYLKHRGIEAKVLDDIDWKIPGQIILQPKTIRQQLLGVC